MSAADDAQLIAQLRLTAPHSDDGYMLLRAANAIEDANARVALAHADALNAAADAFEAADEDALQFPIGWLRKRATAIEVGEI